MSETLALTHVLNQIFGGVIVTVMHALGLTADPATVIDDALALEILVATGLILFFVIVRMTLSVEKPNTAQQMAEMVHEFTGDLGEQIIGHGYERFQAFATCVGLFVLLNNLLGLIPGVPTPTAKPVVPLGVALLTFLYYNFHGVRVQGVIGYLKHFAGPLWWLAPLLFPIEIVSHCARVLALTIRLYANMLASDMLTMVFFSMIPMLVPSAFLGLHLVVSLIQAYVFMLLSLIYLSEAVAKEH
jgi:F-type H+-transporting ATPase subunit a